MKHDILFKNLIFYQNGYKTQELVGFFDKDVKRTFTVAIQSSHLT